MKGKITRVNIAAGIFFLYGLSVDKQLEICSAIKKKKCYTH